MRRQADIIIKRYDDKETLWVSEGLLCDNAGVGKVYLDSCARLKAAKKGSKSWRWVRMHGTFYYDYFTIPNRAPNYYRSKLGSREALIASVKCPPMSGEVLANAKERLLNEWSNMRRERSDAIYYYMNNRGLELKEAANYADAWCFMLLISNYIFDRSWVQLGLDKSGQLYGILVAILKDKELPGLNISNPIALRNKINQYDFRTSNEVQWDGFIHGLKGNQNALKIPEFIKQAAIYLKGLGLNWSDAMVYRKICRLCEIKDIKAPSQSSIDKLLSEKYVRSITEQGRSNIHKLTYGALPIADPLFAGDCWQMDGTRVNMVPHGTSEAEKKEQKYLYIVAVRDVYSRCLLGWSYGYAESHNMYLNALQMACERTGYLPYELVADRFPGHKTEQWQNVAAQLQRLGVQLTISSEPQQKAQIERCFGVLQSVFMSDTPYYYGEGVKSTRSFAHRTEVYLKSLKKIAAQSGWDWQQATTQMDGVIQRYNETKLNSYGRVEEKAPFSPNELLKDSDTPNVVKINAWQSSWLFSLRKTLKIQGAGFLSMKAMNVPICYKIEAYDIAIRHKQVVLCYDLRDLSVARIFTSKGIYLCDAEEVSPVQVFGPGAEVDRISDERSRVKLFAGRALREYNAIAAAVCGEQADEVGQLMPRITPKITLEVSETALIEGAANAAFEKDSQHLAKGATAAFDEEDLPPLTEELLRGKFYDALGNKE